MRPLTVKRATRINHRQCGIANIWLALLAIFLIGIVGLASDIGYVLLVAHQLQNAADAASLAGAQLVRVSAEEARAAGLSIAFANRAGGESVQLLDNVANAPGGDIVIGRYDRGSRLFTPTLSAPNAVKVVGRRTQNSLGGPVGLFFGPVFGVETVDVERTAIAMVGGGTGAGLIALDPEKKNALEVSGTVTLNVDGGAIQVNSSHPQAVLANGTPDLIAPELNVYGDARFVGGATYDGVLNTGSPPVPDPLEFLPEPTWDPAMDHGTVSILGGETMSISPGYYSGGISMNNGSLTLAPGVYILDGTGLDITGGNMYAEGVMFYIVDTDPNDNTDSHVKLVGNGITRISPPDPEIHGFPGADTYEGISFFQARDNPNEATFVGTSLLDLEGTLYFSAAHMDLGGTSDGFGNQLIANSIRVHGTGEIHINYDGRYPAVGNRVFLVE